MNPANVKQAGRQVRQLLKKRLTGISHDTKRRYIRRAEIIAERIWGRWQVGPFRWRSKHIEWFQSTQLTEYKPRTKYAFNLVLQKTVRILDDSKSPDPT
jgi:hypothetical protein